MITQYLPFAYAGSANVVPVVTWPGLTELREQGFVSGLASATHANTVLRQASVAAAGVAYFSATYGSHDVLDDGNFVAFAEALHSAVQNMIPPPGVVTVVAADNISGNGTGGSPLVAHVRVTDNIGGDGTTGSPLYAAMHVGDNMAGNGTSGSPLTATVHVGGSFLSGNGSAGSPLTLNLAGLAAWVFQNVDCSQYIAMRRRCELPSTGA